MRRDTKSRWRRCRAGVSILAGLLVSVGSLAITTGRGRASSALRESSGAVRGDLDLPVGLLREHGDGARGETDLAAAPALGGETGAHDPSRVVRCGDRYWIYCTGPGALSRWS